MSSERESESGTAVEFDIEIKHWSTVLEKIQWELAEPLEKIATKSHGDRIG